ncbi:hypothetical protein Hanom_Chr14g01262011 [Helianthus anomalus]
MCFLCRKLIVDWMCKTKIIPRLTFRHSRRRVKRGFWFFFTHNRRRVKRGFWFFFRHNRRRFKRDFWLIYGSGSGGLRGT